MTFITSVQSTLTSHQWFPILGPLVVSPIKAIVSIAQIVSSLACAVFCSVATLCSSNKEWKERQNLSFKILYKGGESLGCALANLGSLGVASYLDMFDHTSHYHFSNVNTTKDTTEVTVVYLGRTYPY